MLLLGYWKILVITALYVLSQFYSKMHAHHLALNLTDKIMWLQKKNFSLCFSFYFIFHCFELFEILVTSNDCGLKLFLGKKKLSSKLEISYVKERSSVNRH